MGGHWGGRGKEESRRVIGEVEERRRVGESHGREWKEE